MLVRHLYLCRCAGVESPAGHCASPIGTKDFFDKTDENGKGTGHSTYYFPDGSVLTNYTTVVTGTNTGGHVVGKYQIVSGTGAYQGATGTGGFEGDWGGKSALKGAGLYNVELDVKTPGS